MVLTSLVIDLIGQLICHVIGSQKVIDTFGSIYFSCSGRSVLCSIKIAGMARSTAGSVSPNTIKLFFFCCCC